MALFDGNVIHNWRRLLHVSAGYSRKFINIHCTQWNISPVHMIPIYVAYCQENWSARAETTKFSSPMECEPKHTQRIKNKDINNITKSTLWLDFLRIDGIEGYFCSNASIGHCTTWFGRSKKPNAILNTRPKVSSLHGLASALCLSFHGIDALWECWSAWAASQEFLPFYEGAWLSTASSQT